MRLLVRGNQNERHRSIRKALTDEYVFIAAVMAGIDLE